MSQRVLPSALWVLVCLCAAALGGCLLPPNDEQTLCGSDAPVTLAGYTLDPGDVVVAALSYVTAQRATGFIGAATVTGNAGSCP